VTLTLQHDLDIHHDLDLRDLDLITYIFDPAATSLPFAVIPLNGIGFDWFTHSVTLTLLHLPLTISATSLQFAVMALRFTTLQYDLDIHHDLDLRDLDLITLIFDPAATSLPFAVIPLNGIGFDWFTHSVTLTLTRCRMTLTLSATLTVLLRDVSFVDQ